MPRSFALAIGLLALAPPTARSDDTIAPETVAAVKRAAVYVRVAGDGWGGSGSGFVVGADNERVLVVTNHHVAVRLPPGARPGPPAVSVVFGSGTAAEREYPATVVGADSDSDLAVLRVTGVKDPPRPISYVDPVTPVETMGVYSFGYPLGQALSGGRRFPAVTVGRASVSSLRDGDDGQLAAIQIDGNLNPGNSGGPVVDAKGRLIGVAVARAKDGQGIGFLVPVAEVGRLMAGRIGRVRVVSGGGTDGKSSARIEAELIDPLGVFRAVNAYCVVVPSNGTVPTGKLDTNPDARPVRLKAEKNIAAGDLKAEPTGVVVVQVIADRGAGTNPALTRPRVYSLVPSKPTDFAGRPPAGWREYSPAGRPFVVWLPEAAARPGEERRTISLVGVPVSATGTSGRTDAGLTYRAEALDLAPVIDRITRFGPAFRTVLQEETGGRVTDVVEAKAGDHTGAEYWIEAPAGVTRVRVYAQGQRVYALRVTGSPAQVVGPETETILGSFRPTADGRVVVTRVAPGPAPAPRGPRVRPINPRLPHAANPGTIDKTITGGTEPYILGTIEHDPKFKAVGPDGAILIGLEARFGKFGTTEIVRAVRPIYRVNGKEEFGQQFGNDLSGSVTLKAKDGYAVGGITGKAGWWCNGFALIFMRVKADGTLDPNDNYASEWVGFNGRESVTRVTTTGAPVVGIVGKIVRTETTALGLLYKGQEGFDPAAGKR